MLGRAGYWLMSVTALFATAGATNAGLYPAAGLCEQMAAIGQFPPGSGRRFGGRAPAGLAAHGRRSPSSSRSASTSTRSPRSAAPSPCSSSPSSRVALPGPPRDRRQPVILGIAVASTVIVLVTFAFTTLVDEPGTAVALVVILALSVVLDQWWKRVRTATAPLARWPVG